MPRPAQKGRSPNYTIPSVLRALDILQLLSDQKGLTLTQISRHFGIPFSTCHNILETLASRGFITRDPLTNQYSLGLHLMHLGIKLHQNLDHRKMIYPFMQRLVDRFEETSYFAVLDHTHFEGIVVERVQSPKVMMVLLTVGQKFPLHCSTTGKILMSWLNDDELDRYVTTVERQRFTEYTLTTPAQIRQEVAKIRRLGYSIMCEEHDLGVMGVAAPIRNHEGKVIAGISIAGPKARIEVQLDEVIAAVVEAGNQVSRLLGRSQ